MVIGEIALFAAMVLATTATGSTEFDTVRQGLAQADSRDLIILLALIGFGIKVGVLGLHVWLPLAHPVAPTPASAVLSGAMIKAGLLGWLRLLPLGEAALFLWGEAFMILGIAAAFYGVLVGLTQRDPKTLLAYSSISQMGIMTMAVGLGLTAPEAYPAILFLAYPLAFGAGATAWSAMAYLVFSHALAKAAMFLAAGNLMQFGGHDRIADLDRVVQRLPLTAGAFALAGVSIMGLPPSGGFNGKWLLLQAALAQGRWDLVGVMLLGGLLAAGYVFKVLGHAFTQAPITHEPIRVPARMQWAALLLAAGAILVGFLASPFLALVGVGDPFHVGGPGHELGFLDPLLVVASSLLPGLIIFGLPEKGCACAPPST